MKRVKHTKQQILEVSLDLFSEKGFAAVSIRDICKEVQIKESSIYYHFKNKQAILDELFLQFEQTASSLMTKLEQALAAPFVRGKEPFYQTVCHSFFEDYLMNPFCNKIMRLLSIERSHDALAARLYDRWMFDEPLAFQSKIFTLLMEADLLPHADSRYTALRYYAPIYLLAQRYLFYGPLDEIQKENFRSEAYNHLQHFFCEMEANS